MIQPPPAKKAIFWPSRPILQSVKHWNLPWRGGGCAPGSVESPGQIDAAGPPADRPIPLTEPLQGPDRRLMEFLTVDRPDLILFDSGQEEIPWARWIQVIKTSAATRRIPVVAFGAGSDEAESAGADVAISREDFLAAPKRWLDIARPVAWEAIERACQGSLSEAGLRGIALHNAGEYFEAHELLEQAWMAAAVHEKYLYRSLLQLTVAHLQVQRGNLSGATKMLLRIRQWIGPLPERCCGVEVGAIRQGLESWRQALSTPSSTDHPEARLPAIPIQVIQLHV